MDAFSQPPESFFALEDFLEAGGFFGAAQTEHVVNILRCLAECGEYKTLAVCFRAFGWDEDSIRQLVRRDARERGRDVDEIMREL